MINENEWERAYYSLVVANQSVRNIILIMITPRFFNKSIQSYITL